MKKSKAKLVSILGILGIALCLCFFINYTAQVVQAAALPTIYKNDETTDPSTTSLPEEPSGSASSSSTSSSGNDGFSSSDNTSSNAPESLPAQSDSTSASSSATPESASSSLQAVAPMVDETNLIRVGTFEELNAVLTGPMQDGKIVLTADIVATGGISVDNSWTEFVIDGQDPDTGALHTFTEKKSTSANDTILISSSGAMTENATLKNIIVSGYNYYGPICVRSSAKNIVTLSYENVTYVGPQMTYNQKGNARYIDCTINIQKNDGSVASQELAEATIIEIGGNTTINTETTSGSNPVFNIISSPSSITVLEGANVSVTTATAFVGTADANATVFTVKNGANLSISAALGITDNTSTHYVSSISVEENATLIASKEGSGSSACVSVKESVTVSPNGTLVLTQNNGTGPALYFRRTNAVATFTSPKKVQLEAYNGSAIQFTSAGTMNMNTQAVNLWTTLLGSVTNSMESIPTNIWNMQDGSEFNITAAMSGSNTSSVTTTWQGKETQWNKTLDATNFTPGASSSLIFGSYSLNVPAQLTQKTTNVVGTTNENAQVGVFYNSIKSTSVADASGNFSVPVDFSSQEVDDEIGIITSHDQIKAYQLYPIVKYGELKFLSVPSTLPFTAEAIPAKPSYLTRMNSGWSIGVDDTRGADSTWRLDASIGGSFTDTSGHVLDGTLRFVNGSSTLSLSSVPITIYNGTTGSTSATYVSWDEDQGLLLWLDSISSIVPGVTYKANIEWSLIDAP